MKTNHSPLPWNHAIKLGLDAPQNVRDADNFTLAQCSTIDVAEFIVRCCNAHDELVAALEKVCAAWPESLDILAAEVIPPGIKEARAILAKVQS